MNERLQAGYVAVGHVTVDVLPDGSSRPGGTALYAALQAARLGVAATIVTRGRPAEIERLLAPFAGELSLIVQPGEQTTTFDTRGSGSERRQRLLAWAGEIDLGELPASRILHLAPVAAELSAAELPPCGFVGLTPQGLARGWSAPGEEVRPRRPAPERAALAERCDALVVSEQEVDACAELLERAARAGALVVVTAGSEPAELRHPGGRAEHVGVPPVARAIDDLGAGDVYAAALFVALAEGAGPASAAALAGAAAAHRLQGVGAQAIGRRDQLGASVRDG